MSKKSVNINNIEDAVGRITSPNAGDSIIIRAVSITVPEPMYDMAITNATMQMLLDNFKDPNAVRRYDLTTLDGGRYEIMAVFHLRRIGEAEKPVLN